MAGMKELREAAQKEMTAREAVKEGAKEFGGMMKETGGKLWDALTPAFEHGAHEMASLLYRGDAFVLYPRQSREGQNFEGQGMDSLRAYAKELAEDRGKEQGREIGGMER